MSHLRVGHSAGQLETRGIEPVPENECNGNPLQLFWVWFAANISILGLPLGLGFLHRMGHEEQLI